MKKLFIAFALVAIGSGAFAQANKTRPKTQAPVTAKEVNQNNASKIYYTSKEGKVVVMKGNTMFPFENDVLKFENGNYITQEGVFVYNSGSEKMMLEEGIKIDMNGNIMDRAAEKTLTPKDQPNQAVPEK